MGENPSSPIVADKEVDARHLNCPLPILRAKKALSELNSGQVLRLITTDPNAKLDIRTFTTHTGNALLAQHELMENETKVCAHLIRRR